MRVFSMANLCSDRPLHGGGARASQHRARWTDAGRAPNLGPMRPIAVLIATLLLALPAQADSVLFVLDQSQLPFDLSPGAKANSPANIRNAPSQPGNSAANWANSSKSARNAPENPANAPDGVNAIYTTDGEYAGYATRAGGALNLFSASGRRVAYQPAGGHTKSLMSNAGEWCGTVTGASGGGFAFGLTMTCAKRFFRD